MQTTDIQTLIAEDVDNHVEALEVSQQTSDDILKELSDSIKQVDFQILAFPEIADVREELENLMPEITNPDGSYNKDNEDGFKKYQELSKKLKSFVVTKNHYLILVVEQLLKTAEANKWGLCKKHGFIYLYNGTYWMEIGKEQFQFFLRSVALKMGVEKFKAKPHTFQDDLFKQFMADSYLPTPKPKKGTTLLNLPNGTLEITATKRVFREHRQEDFITHQLPFEYLPEATAPRFQSFLDEVIPDPDKQKVLAEYLGSIFIKSSVLKLEKALILYGTGANGKSVLFEIVNALLGSENVSNSTLQKLTESNGYSRAKIANKLVNYASEINGKMEVDVFKQMVSGEPIEARLPYGDPFTLTDYAKLIFNCNELPTEVEHTNAFFRRFLIIGFDVTIPEDRQDKELARKIINSELAGVFNWILEGLERLLSQKNFTKCEAVENARTNYEQQSDSVKMFIEENGYVASKDLHYLNPIYEAYKGYCIEDGYHKVSYKKFRARLAKYQPTRTTVNGINGWHAYLTEEIGKEILDGEF